MSPSMSNRPVIRPSTTPNSPRSSRFQVSGDVDRAREIADAAREVLDYHDFPRYSFVTVVDCYIIDEVHLLDSDERGRCSRWPLPDCDGSVTRA
jgi:hypothetical protein